MEQLLAPSLQEPQILAVIEYSDVNSQIVMTVRYNGPRVDVTKAGNDLALSVLRGVASGIEYTEVQDSSEYTNQLRLEIRSQG